MTVIEFLSSSSVVAEWKGAGIESELSDCCIKADSHIACRAHAVPLSWHAVNLHMPCHAPAMLRQCRVLRDSPRGSRKYPNC